MRQIRVVNVALVILALCWSLSLAQAPATIETAGSPHKSRIKWLQPTVQGSTGLFTIYSAEGLRRGEFSLMGGVSNYDRSPGNLDITNVPVAFTLGLHDRVEWAVGFYPYRMVRSVGPTQGYYNETPFLKVPPGGAEFSGLSDLFSSVKFNLMSETRNQPFGLAIRGNVKIPTSSEDTRRGATAREKGLTTGTADAGVEVLFSKFAGPATIMLNTGVQGIGEHTSRRELQSEYRYGAGVAFGTHPLQAIFEVNGVTWFGSKGVNNPLTNPVSPVDLLWGLRFAPVKWIAIGAAYRFNAHTWENDLRSPPSRSGFVGTLAVNRKINRPPMVECTTDNATIQQRGQATVRATASDPDDSSLTINWRTSGGRLVGSGSSVTLETGTLTETAPGRYTVSAEVSDGEDTATCSVDVNVEKLKIAPRVTCEPATQTIEMGATATIRASASDENPGDTLTYVWEVDGQRAAETGSTFTFGSTGRNPGRHTIKVTVTDPDGMSASCESIVQVNEPPPPPNRDPACDVSLSPSDLYVGAALRGTARGSDPDGDTLTYQWSLDGRILSDKTGAEVDIDTAGLAGGSHTVSVRVSDGKGGEAECSASFTVRSKVVIELPALRIDNAAKARLDDIALQMQNDPRLTAVITGFDTARQARIAQRNGLRVAQLAKNYLTREHKIDAGRIEARSGGQGTPRRIEIEITSR
ncbi:MAG: PKD domain-containing protein [Acidobacteria bacterium]|nr:PKD domain-containing protein [Acidobacteriota bacterium]